MYDDSDPRAGLDSSRRPIGSDDIASAETVRFTTAIKYETQPVGSRTWFVRAQNFVLSYSELRAGDHLDWDDDRGYVVIAAVPGTRLTVTTPSNTAHLRDRGIVVVPPGTSRVTSESAVRVARMFESASKKAAARATNAESYRSPHPRVTTVADDLPQPARLAAHHVCEYPADSARFGAIFQTPSLMVNFLDIQDGPRDPEKLSPHHHEDFEQGSFTVDGIWLHHIRTPWTTRRSQWREDEHIGVQGASLTIIPPPTIHTSQAIGAGTNLMVDLFSPPRLDFAEKGWVLNQTDVPQ